ncbi:MAG: hypothetical protein ABI863_21985 [Ginsengibacter sp.]
MKLIYAIYFFLLTFIGLTQLACKTPNPAILNPAAAALEGKWRMVSVKDNSTNIVTAKPSTITGNVDITFALFSSAAGIMSGVTPTNSLNGNYSTGGNGALSIPAVSATKIIETTWGQLFLDNITWSHDFIFNADGRLHINASTNKTLIFVRQ